MDIYEFMKEYGVEVPEEKREEFVKAFSEGYIAMNEHSKDTENLEAARDKYKTMYEEAKETLERFEGEDVEQLKKEIQEWKEKAETAEKKAKEEIEARDYHDAIKKAAGELKFTSVSASKAFFAELEAAKLPIKDGKILGFNDFVESYRKEDAGAFVNEETELLEQSKARFTQQPEGGKGKKKLSTAELMKLKNQNPNLDITQYL